MKKLVLGILAHVDAGKTTLSEALLYTCGSIRKLGRVDHRNTALDTHQIERERGITVFSKQAQLRTENMELCLLDTPGHADLTAETERVLDVLDYALLVISGTDGVQAHTETLWHLLERHRVPTIIFATKMDLTASDREKILGDLRARLSENCFDLSDKSQETRESIAMCDEALLEKVASGGDIEDSDLTHLIAGRKLFPVLYGSGLKLEGVSELVEFIENYTVSPVYTEEFGARVYKIMRDARGRRLSCMKITGGVLRNRDSVDGQTVTELRVYSGANYEAVQEACAGSIVAVQGLDDTYAGQGLGFENDGMQPETEAVMSYTVELPKVADAWASYKQLKQLEDEDPQLHIEWNERLREISVRIMGRVQTEVLTELIRERFDLEVSIASGGIAYKETIAAPVHGIGHFEPLRHYSEVHLLIEPNERGSGLSFESRCPTDELCSNWQSLIMTNLAEKTHLGVLTGSPLTDVKISLIAGRAHLKHTEGGDFRQATYRAARQGLMQAESVLLEPFYDFRLELPPECVGRAMTDLAAMGGSADAPETVGGETVLTGFAPVKGLRSYAREVAAYTRGRGRLSCTLRGYEPCADAESVIAAIGYDPERDAENPTGSVFCEHGAGVYVPWNEVKARAHVPCILQERPVEAAEPMPTRSRASSGSAAEDKELLAIFESTYGKVERRAFEPKRAPARTALDETRYNIKNQKTGPEYLLVDGYNIIFAWDALKKLAAQDVAAAREALAGILANYRGWRRCEIILVFDAYKVKGNPGSMEKKNGIYIVYTKEAQTADSYIERATYDLGKNHRVRVATSDNMEQVIILGHGALRISARAFEEEVAEAEGQISDLIERWNVRDFDLRRVRATATIIDKKEEKGS